MRRNCASSPKTNSPRPGIPRKVFEPILTPGFAHSGSTGEEGILRKPEVTLIGPVAWLQDPLPKSPKAPSRKNTPPRPIRIEPYFRTAVWNPSPPWSRPIFSAPDNGATTHR